MNPKRLYFIRACRKLSRLWARALKTYGTNEFRLYVMVSFDCFNCNHSLRKYLCIRDSVDFQLDKLFVQKVFPRLCVKLADCLKKMDATMEIEKIEQ